MCSNFGWQNNKIVLQNETYTTEELKTARRFTVSLTTSVGEITFSIVKLHYL